MKNIDKKVDSSHVRISPHDYKILKQIAREREPKYDLKNPLEVFSELYGEGKIKGDLIR
jgi:hypothetical protein